MGQKYKNTKIHMVTRSIHENIYIYLYIQSESKTHFRNTVFKISCASLSQCSNTHTHDNTAYMGTYIPSMPSLYVVNWLKEFHYSREKNQQHMLKKIE